MLDLNAIPWTTDELIDYGCLVAAAVMVASFPVFYAARSNKGDRLAWVILFATSATAAAFVLTAVLWPLEHAGVILPEPFAHWLTRAVYLTVGLGKLLLTFALIRERRDRTRDVVRKSPRKFIKKARQQP